MKRNQRNSYHLPFPREKQIGISLLLGILLAMGVFGFVSCKSQPKKNPSGETAATAPEPKEIPQPEVLRLGYDIVYKLNPPEKLESTTNLQPTGYIYSLSFGDRVYRVSSTSSENRENFPYWRGASFLEKSKPYLILYPSAPNGTKAGLTLALHSDEAYSRWEWNYQGTLVVIEALVPKDHPAYPMNLDELKLQGEAMHAKIRSHLVLY